MAIRWEETLPFRLLFWAYSPLQERTTVKRLRDPKDGRPLLLVVNHFFDGELAALEAQPQLARAFRIERIRPQDLFRRNSLYFPVDVWCARIPYEDGRLGRRRSTSRANAARIWQRILGACHVAAILTPSDQFYWLREFIKEGQSQGIPTVVLDKEGTISPIDMELHSQKVKTEFPPLADRVYVWSERQREFWLRCGAAAKRIRVTGSLRTDNYVNLPPPGTKAILYFDFDPMAYLTSIPAAEQVPPTGWGPLKDELHDVLVRAARRHPEVRFTVKCHPQQADVNEVQARWARDGLANVQVLTGSVGVDRIVADHSMVIGFQTTALMEVALTDRPAVYCGWGPVHERFKSHLVPLMEPGFGLHLMADASQLEAAIEAHLRGEAIGPAPDRSRLDRQFHAADGNVAGRVAEALQADLADLGRLSPMRH